jgi:hypothetical protein
VYLSDPRAGGDDISRGETKECNGNILQGGDSVHLIKDLKVVPYIFSHKSPPIGVKMMRLSEQANNTIKYLGDLAIATGNYGEMIHLHSTTGFESTIGTIIDTEPYLLMRWPISIALPRPSALPVDCLCCHSCGCAKSLLTVPNIAP